MTAAGLQKSRFRGPDLESGDGFVDVECVAGRSTVVSSSARSPLKLVFPRNHGESVWVFTSSFGGGMVDGDRVRLRVGVGDGASTWLTSQAANKIYRSRSGTSQELRADVGQSGLLVVAPDPVLCFAASRFTQRSKISLADGGAVVFVDAFTAGRVAFGERWSLDSYRSVVQIDRAQRLLLRDAIEISPAHGDVSARMGRFVALATVIAIGPRAKLAAEVSSDDGVVVARSNIEDGILIRIAAHSASELNATVRALLAPLAENLGDDPFARKW